jgi:hypothetical protein
MDMGQLARSMRARMPWPVGQRVLRENELPRGQGWEKTVALLSNADVDYSDKVDAIAQALKEHLLCGEKLVRFYELDKKTKAKVADALLSAKIPNSPFKKAYPLVLSDEELEGQSTNPTLVAVEKTDDAVAAVFASVRSVMLREPIAKDELPEDALEMLARYDEVVGVRYVRHQALDVVSVSTKGPQISVRIDYPQGVHRDLGVVAQERVRERLAGLINLNSLTTPINLFPLINAMYKTRGEGIVVELAFGTTTASLKHEKMRRRLSCLRDEAYHKGARQP